MENNKQRFEYKHEIATKLGISVDTLRRYLKPHIEALQKLGYTQHQKYLTPKQVEFVLEIFVFVND